MTRLPLDPAEDVALVAQLIADGVLPPPGRWPIHLTGSPTVAAPAPEEEP